LQAPPGTTIDQFAMLADAGPTGSSTTPTVSPGGTATAGPICTGPAVIDLTGSPVPIIDLT
jgi:hypothetical protein